MQDSAFLLFLIIFPDPYSLFMQLLENLVSWNFHVSCLLFFAVVLVCFGEGGGIGEFTAYL